LDSVRFQRHKLVEYARTQLKLSEYTMSFLKHLEDGGNLKRLKDSLKELEKIIKAHRKEIDVRVTVAHELSGKELEKFKKDVAERLLRRSADEKFALHVTVDPSIVGGYELYARGSYVNEREDHKIDAFLEKFKTDELGALLSPDYVLHQRQQENTRLASSIIERVKKLTAAK